MKLQSWGNYPSFEGKMIKANDLSGIKKHLFNNNDVIAQGAQKSYGDSAFASHVLNMQKQDCLLEFDSDKGILRCQAGVVFADILAVTIKKGWVLPVLPGTKYLTIGGAIASDIHGKNHHRQGCFSQYVTSLTLMTSSGEVLKCSENVNQTLFHATCGGMGLTGIIIEATIQLLPIACSFIKQKIIKVNGLKSMFKVFEKHADSEYSVAWIDALSDGSELGKGLLILGEHDDQNTLTYGPKKTWKLPFFLPRFCLNRWSIQLFNWLYYMKAKEQSHVVKFDDFFFPLDAITDWNKCYGKNGFVQYQFVLPLADSLQGMTEILQTIIDSKQTPFLTVLKRLGASNKHLLSFPMDGYTLAVDFKVNDKVLDLLEQLDQIIIKYHGRVYLCKDARMSKKTFDATYDKAAIFRKVRREYAMTNTFNSCQSRRLGL